MSTDRPAQSSDAVLAHFRSAHELDAQGRCHSCHGGEVPYACKVTEVMDMLGEFRGEAVKFRAIRTLVGNTSMPFIATNRIRAVISHE